MAHAHWDDEFDEKTGLVCSIVKPYEEASRNTVEERTFFRDKGRIETDRISFVPLIPTHTQLFFEQLFNQEKTMTHYELGKPRELDYVNRRCMGWVNR